MTESRLCFINSEMFGNVVKHGLECWICVLSIKNKTKEENGEINIYLFLLLSDFQNCHGHDFL